MSLPSEDTNVIYSKQNGILFLHFYCDFFHRSIFFQSFAVYILSMDGGTFFKVG